MKKVSCENGHFYDADRYQSCPVCGSAYAEVITQQQPTHVEKVPTTEPLLQSAGGGKVSQRIQTARRIDELAPTERLLPEDELRLQEAVDQHQRGAMRYTVSEVTDKPKPQEVPDIRKDESPLTEAIKATAAQEISSLPKTMAYYDFDKTIPPVAWIVCTKGCYLGEAFECHAGRNRLGRANEMEICLYKDQSITRDTHASIIYEPKRRQFFVQPGSGDALIYLNENLVFSHEELHAYDKLAIGKLEFVFIPLCGERFTWDDFMLEGRNIS